MRQITKVKLSKESKVHIEYRVERTVEEVTDYDMFTLDCIDKPIPQFNLAMMELRKHVLEICEMPADDLEVMKIMVKGVSFSYSGVDDVMGATIIAIKKLNKSNTPLMINTPHKFAEPHSENQGAEMCLTEECIEVLEELINQAEKYLDGERAQLKLDLTGNAGKEAGENKLKLVDAE